LNVTGALEKRRNFLPRPAELAEGDHAPRESDGADEAADEELRRLPRGSGSCSPNAPGCSPRRRAMSTAAMPTSECIAATSSASGHLHARGYDRSDGAADQHRASIRSICPLRLGGGRHTAITMRRRRGVARRADSGEDSPFSARMKQTEAARYPERDEVGLISFVYPGRLLLTSRACAAHEEAPGHVYRRESPRHRPRIEPKVSPRTARRRGWRRR